MGFFKTMLRKYDPFQMNRLSKLILGKGILDKKGTKAAQQTPREKTLEKTAMDREAQNNALAIRKGKR